MQCPIIYIFVSSINYINVVGSNESHGLTVRPIEIGICKMAQD